MTNNNWVKNLAAGIRTSLDASGVNCTINETKIDWASLAESADVLPYDVMLTPGDPTCFGNDPDLLMSWWYGDNVWTQGRSCWKKAGDGKFDELQTLMRRLARPPATSSRSCGTSASTFWPRKFRCTRCSTASWPRATRRRRSPASSPSPRRASCSSVRA